MLERGFSLKDIKRELGVTFKSLLNMLYQEVAVPVAHPSGGLNCAGSYVGACVSDIGDDGCIRPGPNHGLHHVI